MINLEANVTIGYVTDGGGPRRRLRRDNDRLMVPAMSLTPAGVAELKQAIAEHENEVARFRLRTLDFDRLGIDLDEARAELADIPGFEGTELQIADWNEIGRRLGLMTPWGGYPELRKLTALLMADEVATGNA